MMVPCKTCASLSGEQPLFPESRMYEGQYWILEHAYPTGVLGWIVIILKRHVEALHLVSPAELQEWAEIMGLICPLLHDILDCEKEYVGCYCEGEGFAHLHFHVVAKPENLPQGLTGSKIFKIQSAQTIDREEILDFCDKMRGALR